MCDVNKFKVGGVVKCVDNGIFNNLTLGKDYVLLDVSNDGGVEVKDDKGFYFYYYSYRFELSGANAQQAHKFKEGDMVYLIGFSYFKPCKLTLSDREYSQHLKLKVVTDDGIETFTENGCYTPDGTEPSIVLATEENRQMLNKLLGVEYEPVKLTGGDLAKKLLKDKPQTCYVSDVSDVFATSSGCVIVITEFENDRFISKNGAGWKFAVPCNQHGEVLYDTKTSYTV